MKVIIAMTSWSRPSKRKCRLCGLKGVNGLIEIGEKDLTENQRVFFVHVECVQKNESPEETVYLLVGDA